ncbi:MAG: sulfate/molybdate ABC transporter ATP-binding protein [Clostridia bacterium]|nr:sulfate/molybdate ABC transporter ATP-binding protein [Clostridia bacterium]
MELEVDITKQLKDFTLRQRFKLAKETLGFLGASGSGKSMTLKCIAGLVTPDEGRIVLNGRVLFDSRQGINLPIQQRRVGLLFQNYALFPNLTVKENIAFGLRGLPKKEREERTERIMALLGIAGIRNSYPRQISGGEQQRAALARTLVTEPECLLLDEPFSALDNHIRSRLEQQLLEIIAGYQGPVVFVTHNLKECYRLSRQIMIIHQGEAVAYGSRDEVFDRPQRVEAARLTGCKNISRMELVTPRRVKALDWGLELELLEEAEPGQGYLGIREHRLRLVEDPNLPNTFPAWVDQVRETPFDVSLVLRLGEDREEAGSCQPLQLTLSKEDYETVKARPCPWWLQLRPEHLFLME